MKYEKPTGRVHEEAESLARDGSSEELANALIGLALEDDDSAWTTAFCLRFVDHADEAVRGNALLAFGHLARRFRKLESRDAVLAAIARGLEDASAFVRGQADAARDDVTSFAKDGSQ